MNTSFHRLWLPLILLGWIAYLINSVFTYLILDFSWPQQVGFIQWMIWLFFISPVGRIIILILVNWLIYRLWIRNRELPYSGIIAESREMFYRGLIIWIGLLIFPFIGLGLGLAQLEPGNNQILSYLIIYPLAYDTHNMIAVQLGFLVINMVQLLSTAIEIIIIYWLVRLLELIDNSDTF